MRLRRAVVLAGGVVAAAAAYWAARDVPAAMGAKPAGARAQRVLASPNYRDGRFHNRDATRMSVADAGSRLLREFLFGGPLRRPPGPIPVVTRPPGLAPSREGLHITWYGHASALLEMDGRRVLIDPVWSDRCSPSQLVGPKRFHPVPIDTARLPTLDAVLVSHDHYDHLDMATVRSLRDEHTAPFIVPLGVGAHLERWGVPDDRIVELDWHDRYDVGGITFVATPAQHFSGRGFSRDGTLWASWVIAAGGRRVFYTGDTGYFPGFAEIGVEHGPFDATLVQVGAYDPAWPDIHMFPEDAVIAHQDVHGGLLIPVHWATWDLFLHTWADPIDRLWAEAKASGVALCVPRPGERVTVDDPPPVDGWWQALAG